MHILILATNQEQAEFVKKGVSCENLPADVIRDDACGHELFENLSKSDGAIILSDNAERSRSVMDLCRNIKPSMPFMILAGSDDSIYTSLLKDNKIAAYFIRPFPFRQIAAEMKYAIFRMREKADTGKYVLRDLEVDVLSHNVSICKVPVYLRNKEFSLLHYMIVNKGRVLSRSDILQNVWDRNTNILTNTVDVHVSQLRKKIRGVAVDSYIRTIPCMGYMLE